MYDHLSMEILAAIDIRINWQKLLSYFSNGADKNAINTGKDDDTEFLNVSRMMNIDI